MKTLIKAAIIDFDNQRFNASAPAAALDRHRHRVHDILHSEYAKEPQESSTQRRAWVQEALLDGAKPAHRFTREESPWAPPIAPYRSKWPGKPTRVLDASSSRSAPDRVVELR